MSNPLKFTVMKNRNILILLFLLISSNIFAQKAKPVLHQVTGTIYNEINLPIAYAIVTLSNSNVIYQTETDSNGSYCIEGIPEGNFSIIINKEFNKKQFDTLILDKTIGLVVKNYNLEYLYFSSSCRIYGNRTISCNNVIDILNPLLRAPNRNVNTIAAYVRGVDSRNGETPSIKGARPENTAYYIDGVRITGIEEN